jgi:adenylate kinase family enzyme
MSNSQRFKDCVERIDNLIVMHPRFCRAIEHVEWCLSENMKCASPRGLLIVGPSGSGKSTIKAQIMAMRECTGGATRGKPVVCATVPSIPTIKSLANTVLCSMEDPLWHKGTAPQLTHRTITLLRGLSTRVILLDEVQHFADSSRYRGISRAADWVKEVMDQATASFVFLGLPRAEEVLRVNEQLRRRFAAKVDLGCFDIDDSADFLNFRKLLWAFEEAMQIEVVPRLSEGEMAARMYFASNGLPGYLKQLLTGAVRQASKDDARRIEISHLATAFYEEIWAEGHGPKNPFDKRFQFQRLDRNDEPFACVSVN